MKNTSTSKWVIRAGSLLILIGFVLPSMMVSCTGFPGAGQPLSLFDLASQQNQSILYLVPLAILAVIALTFIFVQSNRQAFQFWLGEIGGLVLSALAILFSLLTLYSQINKAGGLFEVRPEIGMFVLVIGYIAVVVGIVLESSGINTYTPKNTQSPVYANAVNPVPITPVPIPAGPPPAPRGIQCRLELVRGQPGEPQVLDVRSDTFTIGRGSNNDLQLSDPQVSRLHARLRYAQGAWFIQDQGSSIGVLVNGDRMPATRLYSGDQITLGQTTYRFIA